MVQLERLELVSDFNALRQKDESCSNVPVSQPVCGDILLAGRLLAACRLFLHTQFYAMSRAEGYLTWNAQDLHFGGHVLFSVYI